MILATLLLLAGGFAAQHNRVPLQWDHCLLLLVASLALLAWRRARSLGYLLVGFLLFSLAGQLVVDGRLAQRYAGDSMLCIVRVASYATRDRDNVTMIVESLGDRRLPERSRVSWYQPPVIPAPGDTWQLELRLRRPRGNSNPGVFDREAWMFREEILASGYVVSGKRNRLIRSGDLGQLSRYRDDLISMFDRATDSESAAVLSAVAVGERHRITRQQWERYAKTGTSHLMAISGLHVGLAGLLGFAVFYALSVLSSRRGSHLIHAVSGSLLTAIVYSTVSGLAIPSQRACLMLLLGSTAFWARRQVSPAHVFAVAAAAVLLANPLSILAPGYWLSFAAVAVLLRFALGHQRQCANDGQFPAILLTFRQLAAMQVQLLLGMMPLTVLFFQRVTLLAPVVNLISVPAFSIVAVPSTLLSMLLLLIDEGWATFFARIAAFGVRSVEWLAGQFAALPIADTATARLSGWMIVVVWLPVLWVLLPRGWPGRGLAAIAVLSVLLHRPAAPPAACFDTHVLDVGQGLAIVLRTRRTVLLYDTGVAYRSGGSAMQSIVIPFLRHQGIRDIDWLIVSHADLDHAGGVADLHAYSLPGKVLLGERLAYSGMNAYRCFAGQRWSVDDIHFRVLHPAAGSTLKGNDRSCVLEVSAGGNRLLLTGDIETRAEQDLVQNTSLRSVLAVVVPHHGSLTSSSPDFVNTLRPQLAIVSAGYQNRWGFPKHRVSSRWQGSGATVLNTANAGAVSFRLCTAGSIQRLRQERPLRARFWRD